MNYIIYNLIFLSYFILQQYIKIYRKVIASVSPAGTSGTFVLSRWHCGHLWGNTEHLQLVTEIFVKWLLHCFSCEHLCYLEQWVTSWTLGGQNLIIVNMYKVAGNLGYYNPSQTFPTLRLKWEQNSCFISAGVQLLYTIEEFREFFISRRFKDISSKNNCCDFEIN